MRASPLLTRAVVLAAVLSLAPRAGAAGELQPLETSSGQDPSGWHFFGLLNKPTVAATRFEVGTIDGQAGVQISTRASYGTWVHPIEEQPAATLHWQWRLDEPLSGGLRAADIRRKDGDDAALKVCVMFDHPLERVPWSERHLLRLARAISRESLPAATVCYLWDPLQAAGSQGSNAYTRRVRYVVLQGQGAPLHQWQAQTRDVAADFATLFADELPAGSDKSAAPAISGIAIGADSDNTGASSRGWVAGVILHSTPRR